MPLPPNISNQADRPLGWWIRGHREHNFHHFGITQENATRGRTRGGLGRGRETPQQEQSRLENPNLAGEIPFHLSREDKEKRKQDTFPTEQMKCLMDSLWEKRNKWGKQHPNFWAMAPQISFKYRPSYHQVDKYNWEDTDRNPYPGWKLAVGHTPSGWKVGIMTDAEYTEWNKQPQSKAAQERKKELQTAATAAALAKTIAEEASLEEEQDPQNTIDISPHKVALHRWSIFTKAACVELAKHFQPNELEEIKGFFEASSFRTHRTDLDALTEDITQCQHLREMLDFHNDETTDEQKIDWKTKQTKDCLRTVFDDVLNIKRHQYKTQARKTGSPELPANLRISARNRPQIWADLSDESSDYSEDSQQPETSASIRARHSLAEIQCLQELRTSHRHLDRETAKIHKEIGCAQYYTDPKFLHRCLPSCYSESTTQETPYMAVPIIKGTHVNSSTHAPTIFLLTSTNPSTQIQFTQTHEDLTNAGLTVIPLLGIDGEKVPLMKKNVWRRAFISWGQNGFPDAINHIRTSTTESSDNGTFWWIFAEDSCKLITYVNQDTLETHFLSLIQQAIAKAPDGVEILQLGYRKLTGKKLAQHLHLDTMRRDKNPEKARKVMRVMGQKLFTATTNGVELLHRRLLWGPVDYFDTCMHELTLAGKAMRSEFPLAGSREHYSLVNGGKILVEEIPERKIDPCISRGA